jgi:hypothetical protein
MKYYELEDQIIKILSISDELDLLIESILEDKISNEDITNLLIGLNVSIKLKYEKIFDTYKKVFNLDEYRS